jgi:hypothetical protein
MALLLRQVIDSGAPPSLARLPMSPEDVAASYGEAEDDEPDGDSQDDACEEDGEETGSEEDEGVPGEGAGNDGRADRSVRIAIAVA